MDFDPSEGCPRCQDYDDIKGELDDLKDIRQEEKENLLEDCRKTKTKLQKKLTAAGIVAIVGVTILGQEVVDKITNRLEGVKNIVNVADDIVSMTPYSTESIIEKTPKQKDEPKEETKQDKPKKERQVDIPFSPYNDDDIFKIVSSPIDFSFIKETEDTFQLGDILYEEYDQALGYDIINSLDIPALDVQFVSDLYEFNNYRFNYIEPQLYKTNNIQTSSIVPEPPILFCLLGISLMGSGRKRNHSE